LGESGLFRLPGLRRVSTYPQMTRVLGDGAVEGFLCRVAWGPSEGVPGHGRVAKGAGGASAGKVRGCRRDGQRRDDVDGGRCAEAWSQAPVKLHVGRARL
jgi:hypothetical protein